MHSTFRLLLAAAAFAAVSAQATTVVDTGTPNGSNVGALALDSNDFYAGQMTLAQGMAIQSVYVHVLGTSAGETFTLTVYADNAQHLPGAALYSVQASIGSDGWNGAAGLSGWNLLAGTYWVAAELGTGDTLGNGSVTGALLDRGAPNPLVRTAFNSGSGYVATPQALSFGLRVDAMAAVPEPTAMALWLVGLGGLALRMRRRA